jgi:ligand-binding sensor domain-containing protein
MSTLRGTLPAGRALSRRAGIFGVALWMGLVSGATRAEALDPSRSLTQYQNDRWQTEQGLPQSTVQAITETRDGYLWVGTLDGLARFDGVRFTVFDARHVAELGSGSVLGLMQDSEGNLWIGRSGAAVIYKDRRFRIAFGEEVIGGGSVWSFCQAPDGAVWAATNSGLVRWSKGGTRVFRKTDGLPTDRLRAVTFDRDGVLWIGTTGGGLVAYANGRFQVFDPAHGFPHAEVRAVVADRTGGVWAATAGGGLARVVNGQVTAYTVADGLPTNQVSALAIDAQGAVWIGTWGAGVCRLSGGRFSSLSSAGGLSADQVWSLYADHEGSVWIGTWVGGLNRLRDRRFMVLGVPEGLSSDTTRAVLHGHDGVTWVATAGGGLNRIEGASVTALRAKDGLPSDETSTLCEDRDGAIWVGTFTNGVARVKGRLITAFGTADGLPGPDVRAVHADRAGVVWAATTRGLARFDGRRFVAAAAPGMPLEFVTAIGEDRAGTLWFGTTGYGLIRLRGGEFRLFTTRDGLAGNRVLAFHEDAAGGLWIGTGGGGISRLRDGRFAKITASDGLWDNYAQAIVEDREGNFWVTCNRGFYRVARSVLDAFADGRVPKVTSIAYGAGEALRSTSFAGGQTPPGALDARGRVWLPSYKGLVVVDPAKIPAAGPAPSARVEDVTANASTFEPGPLISLPAGTRTVTVRYTAVTLIDAERVQFRWRMEGLSGDWVDAGTSREAVYPNLTHGRYRFHVAASTDGRVWSRESEALEVLVAPYFYQTAWFAALGLVAVAGLVTFAVRWRLGLARRREEELQKRVTRALADVHTLRGLLPICAWCKKVRDDSGYWEQIEIYVRDHSAATFSHSICPECMGKVEPLDIGAAKPRD